VQAEFKPFQGEALEILVAWGEKRNEAMELIELACQRHPDVTTAEGLVPLVYRLKQGVEV
jgi:holliday junction DNA helicase RuvA